MYVPVPAMMGAQTMTNGVVFAGTCPREAEAKSKRFLEPKKVLTVFPIKRECRERKVLIGIWVV